MIYEWQAPMSFLWILFVAAFQVVIHLGQTKISCKVSGMLIIFWNLYFLEVIAFAV